MTVISAIMARSFQYAMFADLLEPDYPEVTFTRAFANGVTTLTFSAELDADTTAAIRERMMSRDDADQAERARIRAAVVAGATNLAEMLAARVLGDPVPDAILPE